MRADGISLMIATARLPLCSSQANKQFERPSANDRIWSPTMRVALSSRYSKRHSTTTGNSKDNEVNQLVILKIQITPAHQFSFINQALSE